MISWPRDQRVTWLCWKWLTDQLAKYGSHQCCGSRDIIQVGRKEVRKVDKYDYLITKCGNSTQFRMLFWHILYCKVQRSNFITKCDRLSLQSAWGSTKCDRLYYKVPQVVLSVTVTTKWDVTALLTSLFYRRNCKWIGFRKMHY